MTAITSSPGCGTVSSESYDNSCTCWRCYSQPGDQSGEHVDAPEQQGSPSTWVPLDLAAFVEGIAKGEIVGPVPTLMTRSDGVSLLYPGDVHSLAGEPESGKGWITLSTAASVIAAGGRVLYLDFEDAPSSIVSRLLALGADPREIVERFEYVRPSDPFTGAAFRGLLDGPSYELVVIDGVSEAYSLLGLDPYNNPDAAKFLAALPRPLAALGPAVLEVDHVVKAKDLRGRYALGAQHKLAGIAVAYSTDVVNTPSRTSPGLVKIKVEKDRHGHVRAHASNGVIALARIIPSDNGDRVNVALDAPDEVGETAEFRPTAIMEKVSRLLESQSGLGVKAVRDSVSSKAAYVDLALRILVAEGFVRQEPDGQARRHYSVASYRQNTEPCPDVPTVSEPCPGHGVEDLVPVSPSSRDTDKGHAPPDKAQNANRVPTWTDDQMQSLIDGEASS